VDIKNAMKALQQLKGEYFSVSDIIINQDTFTFKLDTVQRARAKQLDIHPKFEYVETQVTQNKTRTDAKLQEYQEFEKDLFHKLLNKTTAVVEKTNDLMEEIDTQMNKMNKDVTSVKEDVGKVVPHNRDQIDKINKVMRDIMVVEKTLDNADEAMERNDSSKEKLYDVHNKCVEITNSLKPEKLVEMVAQTRQIE
jgi:spore germination protein YaaH